MRDAMADTAAAVMGAALNLAQAASSVARQATDAFEHQAELSYRLARRYDGERHLKRKAEDELQAVRCSQRRQQTAQQGGQPQARDMAIDFPRPQLVDKGSPHYHPTEQL